MRLKTMLLLVIMAIPATALAMGLGEIQLNSGLNEPFDARIELVSVTDIELETLEVKLASEQAFKRYDLPRPFHLQGLQFEIVDTGAGAYVHVTSREPMREPFVTLLVEADWANGRLLREYTVLLDPPIFDRAAQPAVSQPAASQPMDQPQPAAPVEPATESRSQTYTRGTVVETPAQAVIPEEASPYPPVEPYTAPEGTYGRIRRGETLSEIAIQLKPGDVSLNQMMIALYRANPEAFIGNINLIKQGSVLRVPDMADVRAISRSEANQRVKAQIAAWRGESATGAGSGSFAGGGQADEGARLDLVAPGSEDMTADSDSELGAGSGGDASGRFAQLQNELESARGELANSQQSNAALQARVTKLEAEIEEARSLLEIKDNRLLNLQQQAQQAGVDVEPVDEQPAMQDDALADSADQDAMTEETSDVAMQDDLGDELGDDLSDDMTGDLADEPMSDAGEVAMEEGETETMYLDDGTLADGETDTAMDTEGAVSTMDDATTQQAQTEEPASTPVVPVSEPQPRQDKGLLGTIMGYLTNPLILGVLGAVLLIIIVLIVIMKMHAKPVQHKDTVSRWVTEEEDESHYEGADFGEAAEEDDPFAKSDSSVASEAADDDDMHETTMISSSPLEQESGSETQSSDTGHSTLVGGTAVNLDENDPLSEADFHMAYGLYDQAADGLQKALAVDPSRNDLQLKLLEVYFTAGNRDDFVTAARNFQDSGASGSDWQSVLIMGKQIAPDESMFAEGTSAGTDTNVDLDIGGGDDTAASSTDFDLPDETASGNDEKPNQQGGQKDDEMLEFDLGDLGTKSSDPGTQSVTGTASRAGTDSKVGTDSQAEFDKALDELSDSTVGTASMVGDNEPSESAEVDTKLDLARAYVDMGDPDGARSILEEVMEDGNATQKQQAQELLDQLS